MRYPKATKEELTAPNGKFRVLGVDVATGSETVFLIGDFASLDAAQEAAKQKAGVGSPVFIYDDDARMIVRYGSWH